MSLNSTEMPALAHLAAQIALKCMQRWEDDNPRTADYRATDSLYHLRQAVSALGHLQAGTHGPERQVALEDFRRSLA
ncbi:MULTISPECIES: hypothetical protein [Streptomyces]|uniref:hypothetical protein n=1 Tax=Streptomyces TaxID=1883 RepID=UPI00345C59AB